MGPVCRNHCQIRRAKAVSWWIQHSDGPAWNRIYALRARTGETTTKRWLNRRNNAQHNQNRIRRHVTCNDRMWTALITTWAQTAFKIQRLRHVKQLLSYNSFQRLCQDETVLIELVFFAFFLLVFCLRFFFIEGGCYIIMYHMLYCTNMLLPYYHTDLCILYTFAHLVIFSDCNALNIQFRTCNRDVYIVKYWSQCLFVK